MLSYQDISEKILDGETILITGGTGSFGKKFVKRTLEKYNPKKIIIFSRDEMKQWNMAKEYEDEQRVRFFIGDVRDIGRLKMALEGVDIVIHAAATKIVPIAEYNPFECVKTNIIGAMNVIEASLEKKVKKVVALSTDKASSPTNLYGATKLASDKLFIASNSSYAQGKSTTFCVVRYGNVMGSRGSVIPYFVELAKKQDLTITDTRMTRFMITLEQGIELVWKAVQDSLGGEIYVKKIPSMKIIDIAEAITGKKNYKVIGIRPGEKIHEEMISETDAVNTYEYSEYYKILPTLNQWNKDSDRIKDGKQVIKGFSYTSDTNTDWLKKEDLIKWIEHNPGGRAE